MDFFEKSTKPKVVALGFFDGAHIGHRKIFSVAKSLRADCDFAVFTFEGKLFKNSQGNIYTLQEKTEIFKRLGASEIIVAKWEEKFYNLSPEEFLSTLVSLHAVKGFVCGEDFTFGKGARGNKDTLIEFCKKNSLDYNIVKMQDYLNEKISTTIIKEKLSCGDIKNANILLGDNYFINGEVSFGRGDGSKVVFPTANVKLTEDKYKIKSGVYAGQVCVEGEKYNAVINYGVCPTFNCNQLVVEAHLLDFNSNIYNKKVKIEFLDYLRDIKKFNSIEELKEQIIKDKGYFK